MRVSPKNAPDAAPDADTRLQPQRDEGRFSTSPFGRCRFTRLPIATPYLLIALLLTIIGLAGVDRWIYELSRRYFDTPDPLDRDLHQRTRYLWYGLRFFGLFWGGAVVYFIVLGLHRDGWRIANRGLVAVVIAGLACLLLSRLIGRLRPHLADSALTFEPFGETLFNGAGVCMPSSEVTVAFAIAAVLSFAWRRWTPVFCGLAGLTALSRVVIGAHYLSDVVVAAVLGVSVASIVLMSFDRVKARVTRSRP